MDHPGRGFLIALLSVSLIGCSGKKPEPPKPAETPKQEDPTASRISTGGIEVLSRDKKRIAVWNAISEKATVDIAESGAVRAAMTGVTGTIYKIVETKKDGNVTQTSVPGAKFKADGGQADQKTQELILKPNVELTELIDPKADERVNPGILKATKLEWLPTIKMIQLSGNVRFNGRGLVVNSLDTVWVTPDMKQIGTPNSFKNDAKMKNLVAPLLAAVAVASAGSFADEKGNMRLTFSSWRVTRIDEKNSRFNATGNPVIGTWKSQGISFKARTIDGTLSQQADGGYILTQAELAGSVRTEMARTEKIGTTNVQRSSVLTSEKATFAGDAKSGTLNLIGGVVVTSALANSSQWMQLTGTSGNFKLDLSPASKQPLESADINGPVTMRLISKRKNKAGALESTDLTATGRRLTFNSGAQEIELSGGVIVTGKGPAILGKMEVSRVRITLDAQGFVKEIFAEGEPGQATMREGR